MKPVQYFDLLPVEDPSLCTVQGDGNDDSSVYMDLRGKEEQITLPYSL